MVAAAVVFYSSSLHSLSLPSCYLLDHLSLLSLCLPSFSLSLSLMAFPCLGHPKNCLAKAKIASEELTRKKKGGKNVRVVLVRIEEDQQARIPAAAAQQQLFIPSAERIAFIICIVSARLFLLWIITIL